MLVYICVLRTCAKLGILRGWDNPFPFSPFGLFPGGGREVEKG